MSKLLSLRVRSLGIDEREAMEAKIRSISIPFSTSLIMGTKESGTAVKDVTAPGPAIRSSTEGKYSKKSSRVTCLGATARVSISDPTLRQLMIHLRKASALPGPKTPNR